MVSGQDVMAAMEDMELEGFKPQLDEALEAFRRDKTAKKDKKKAKDGSTKNSSGDGAADSKNMGESWDELDWLRLVWIEFTRQMINGSITWLPDDNNDAEMVEDGGSDQEAEDWPGWQFARVWIVSIVKFDLPMTLSLALCFL